MNNVVGSSSTGSSGGNGGGLPKAKSFSAGGSVFYSIASKPQEEDPALEGGGNSGSGPRNRARAGVYCRGEPPNPSAIVSDKWLVVNKSNSSERNTFMRCHSDSSSIHIRRQNAIVTFPVCLDSSTESGLILIKINEHSDHALYSITQSTNQC